MNQETKKKNDELAEKLLAEQNFVPALIAGAVAVVLSAMCYGLVVSEWRFSYGFAAVGIGMAVGLSMRYLGRGIETKFSFVAAAYTIVGCFLGNVFTAIFATGTAGATSVLDIFRQNSLPELVDQALRYISLVDFVFWFVAVWCAVYLVTRSLTREESLAISMYQMTK